MLLDSVAADPHRAFVHMERYVNAGSPSGFTEKHTTSLATRANGPGASFYLGGVDFPTSFRFEEFGTMPAITPTWQMLVHPDMIDDDLLSDCISRKFKAVHVVPTSSARTVLMVDNQWFAKLTYRGLIGRIDRQLGHNQALSAVEVSSRIEQATVEGKLPDRFRFMREAFARVVYIPHGDGVYEWGMVLREPLALTVPKTNNLIIPGFSLFSQDEQHPGDPTLLHQLISKQRKAVEDFLFEDVIAPLYEVYFALLLQCGLQLEAHAQNILFVLSDQFQLVGILARDAESIDKDLSLMEALGIEQTYASLDYKCLREGQYNYSIMHSFMFDFKFGEYLIKPIIDDAASSFAFDVGHLCARIQEYTRHYIGQLPPGFFPVDGKWYSYANLVHDRTKARPYIANPAPRFR